MQESKELSEAGTTGDTPEKKVKKETIVR